MANILVGVTGGISAYKVPSLVSVLVDKGHTVRVIMTESAKKFVGPITFSAISHQPVFDDTSEFTPDGHIGHIELAHWADVFAIAPMTANTGAKIMNHIADNLLTSTALAYTKPIIMFPAMNVNMWKKFRERYVYGDDRYIKLMDISVFKNNVVVPYIIVQPATGKMACGDVGEGKLVDTKTMLTVIERMV